MLKDHISIKFIIADLCLKVLDGQGRIFNHKNDPKLALNWGYCKTWSIEFFSRLVYN